MRRNGFLLLLFLFLFGTVLIGCNPNDNNNNDDDDDDDDDDVTVVEPKLALQYSSYTLKVEETLTLIPNITDATTTLEVIFISDNQSIATVDSTGLVTAICEGTANITASFTQYPNVKATLVLTVEPKPKDPDPIFPLTLTGEASVYIGENIFLTATDLDSPDNVVLWESSDVKTLKVDQNGKVTGVASGTAKVIITSLYSMKTLEKEITVLIPEAQLVEIAPLTIQQVTLTSFRLNAKVLPLGALQNIIWSSSDESVATVDATGRVTPVYAGEVTMKATVKDTNISASITFKVQPTPIEIFDMIHVSSPTVQNITVYGFEVNGTYQHQLITSVSKYLNQPLNITTSLVPSTMKNRPGIIKQSTNYITIHDTASAAASGNASAHDSYVKSGGGASETSSGASWHYTVGNDGIFNQIPNDEVAYHAGDGSRLYNTIDSGLLATSSVKPIVTITDDGYYALNGIKSLIQAPTSDTGVILKTSQINENGIRIVTGANGNWFIGETYYNTTYKLISNFGGNRNSIGIESCVNAGADLFLTWQMLAKLVASLLEEYNLGMDAVVQHHYFSGKDCPMTMRHANMWPYFLELVKSEYLVRTQLKGYNITMISNNPTLISNSGRIIKLPDTATKVSYTIQITNNTGYFAQKVYYVDLPAK